MTGSNNPDSGNALRKVFAAGLTALFGVVSLVACGDDEPSTVPLSEWVDEFDKICLELLADVQSDPDLTEEKFETLADAAIAEIRSLTPPDEMADVATELLDLLSADVHSDGGIPQSEADTLDEAFMSLGIADECIAGDNG